MRIIGSGQIGDNPNNADPGQDVDMVVVLDLDAGATVTVSVDASVIGSALDSFLASI